MAEITTLTQDKSLGEKMKLVARLYAHKTGKAVENSTPFQMARDVKNSVKDFAEDMRDMGAYAKEMAVDGVTRVKQAPGKLWNWTKNKVKQGTEWTGNKIKSGASKLWNKFKQTKFAKGVAQGYKKTKQAVVKTGQVIAKGAQIAAMPVVVPYKAAANGIRKVRSWVDEKAETMARMDSIKDKPNEQIKESVETNVHQDEINANAARGNETETQKQAEEVVAARQEENGKQTKETAENESNDRTQPVAEQTDKPKTAEEKKQELEGLGIDKEKAATISGELGVLAEFKEQTKGNESLYGAFLASFERNLKDKDKGFGLSDEQVAAIKKNNKGLFPHDEEPEKKNEVELDAKEEQKKAEGQKKEEKEQSAAETQKESAESEKTQSNPFANVSGKKMEAMEKAADRMMKDYDKAIKAGRPNIAEEIKQRFEERLSSPEKKKGNFNLSDEQVAAFKETHSKNFPDWKPKKQKDNAGVDNSQILAKAKSGKQMD